MQNKKTLMNIIHRGERGVMLPAEAQMLRDAVELLDELGMLHDAVTSIGDCQATFGFEPSDTQTFRALDDDTWCP